MQLLSLFALHPKARCKGAIAKDGECDCGECDCGIHSRWLETLLAKYDVVGHAEWQPQQTYRERHDEDSCCDFGVCAVSLDALLVMFGELLREALDPHRFPSVAYACP